MCKKQAGCHEHGCKCQSHAHAAHEHGGHEHGEEKKNWLTAAVATAMLAGGIAMETCEMTWFQQAGWAWYLAAFYVVGRGVMQEAWESLRRGDVFNEFMLMTLASIGAFCIGEYPEALAVMLFYYIGEMLQDKAVDRARDHIYELVAMAPDRARVVEKDGGSMVVAPSSVHIGAVIEVHPGERVPLDGVLMGSDAAFNTAALTGESMPQLFREGQEVLAGMIAQDSVVRLRTVRAAEDSAMSHILQMVEEANERKAPAEQFVHKFARVYTPVVIALAALVVLLPWMYSLASDFTYIFHDWFYRALVFLVISCPCALVISIPLSYFAGIGKASTRGILFKGGNYLEAITHIDTVVFDKTGTLTTGTFEVQHVEGIRLAIVAAIERNSNHPIAGAIVKYFEERGARSGERGLGNEERGAGSEEREVLFEERGAGSGERDYTPQDIKNYTPQDVKDLPGYGLSATVDGDFYLVGTLRLLEKEGIVYPERLKEVAETLVVCARNGQYEGCILLADTPKADAAQAIADLRRMGIRHTEILSGDKQALVDKVAAQLGMDKGYGDLLPQDKVAHVERLEHAAFVGDGINDAPVLALSDVGIAMGGLGSDMAIETADVVIQNDRPSRVAEAISIGRLTRRIVHQNIAFAIGIKVLVMLLGVLGMANMWMAVFADVGVALLCVLNAMRIFLHKA